MARAVIRAFLKARIERRRLSRANPGLALGKRAFVHNSRFEFANRMGDDAVVMNSVVGRHTYAGPRCTIVNATIGRYCSIAPDVTIGSGGHPLRESVALHPIFYLARADMGWDFVDRDQHEEFAATHVGNDVWLGAKVTVRDGVTIGDGAVVGAGSVVVRDLAPYGIYGGVPARLIRFRFPAETIERLLTLAWWDRPDAWLRRHAAAFADVDRLLALADTDVPGTIEQ